MPLDGEYVASPRQWVRDQVELFEGSGGTEGITLRDTGLPVVIVTNIGARTGKVRKTPLMRVEHDGRYAAVASMEARRRTRSGTTTCARTPGSSCRTAQSALT